MRNDEVEADVRLVVPLARLDVRFELVRFALVSEAYPGVGFFGRTVTEFGFKGCIVYAIPHHYLRILCDFTEAGREPLDLSPLKLQ